MNTDYYKQLAIDNAFSSTCRYRVSAILVGEGGIISSAVNQPFTHDRVSHLYPDYCHTLHAEAAVILKARVRARKGPSCLFVARVGKEGLPKLSRPCMGCYGLLTGYGVKEIYYTTNNSNWTKEKV